MDGGDLRYGKLVVVDFSKYVENEGSVQIRMDDKFDSNKDFIEKISVISKTKMVCVHMTGRIVIKEMLDTSDSTLTCIDILDIPCPGQLKEDLFDDDIEDDSDADGPNLCTSNNGDMIVVLRQFLDGRKIHSYNMSGDLIYTINCDDPWLGLEPRPGYISMDLDGNFVVCADQDKIVMWSSKTGKFLNTINIPPHYNCREDKDEANDRFCWKGHTDFAFTEDGIIIIHSQRNFPVAADIFLFW